MRHRSGPQIRPGVSVQQPCSNPLGKVVGDRLLLLLDRSAAAPVACDGAWPGRPEPMGFLGGPSRRNRRLRGDVHKRSTTPKPGSYPLLALGMKDALGPIVAGAAALFTGHAG